MSENPFSEGTVAVDEATNPFEADVETVTIPEAETDEVPVATAEAAKEPAKSKSTKPPVPEGYITPVQWGHALTERLRKEGKITETDSVAPQVLYSYVNQGKKPGAKDGLPSYTEGGRENLLKLEEAMEWWDRKEERANERKAAKAAKDKAATEKAVATPPNATEVPAAPVEEVE